MSKARLVITAVVVEGRTHTRRARPLSPVRAAHTRLTPGTDRGERVVGFGRIKQQACGTSRDMCGPTALQEGAEMDAVTGS